MDHTMSVVRSLQSVEPAIFEECVRVASWSLGHESLKSEQYYTVVELLCGMDTFVSLPTEYGKSLKYQVLPVCAMDILSQILGPVHSLGGSHVTEQTQQVSIPRIDSGPLVSLFVRDIDVAYNSIK